MELLYLWIGKYKNIENEGFNFSPKYHFEFKNNELTCEKRNNVPENFFGDNISNVTAIIGANGAGKSSVFEILKRTSCFVQ